jgi:hypothetical protein
MKYLRYSALAMVVVIAGFAQAQSAKKQASTDDSEREKLIGAWYLVRIETPDSRPRPDGKQSPIPQPKGMLIYTRDGHMSVQLMYPKSAKAQSNQYVPNNKYVKDGYEASFGSYEVNGATHILTHHVQGSNTRDLLVGKDLPRKFQFTEDAHLIIRSARPDEHWSVTWAHY